MPKPSDLTKEEFKHIRTQVLLMTPTEFAARIGCSTAAVYYYENGAHPIPYALGELIKLLYLENRQPDINVKKEVKIKVPNRK